MVTGDAVAVSFTGIQCCCRGNHRVHRFLLPFIVFIETSRLLIRSGLPEVIVFHDQLSAMKSNGEGRDSMVRIEMFPQQDDRYQIFLQLRDKIMPGQPRMEILPETLCLLAWQDEHCLARASVTIVDDFRSVEGSVGIIGHYEATDPNAGTELLRIAQKRLTSRGAEHVIGPMNGNIWMPYRFALPRGVRDTDYQPAFFLGEPQNSMSYPQQWEAVGFIPTHTYQSRIFTQLHQQSLPAQRIGDRAVKGGVTFTSFQMDRYNMQLQAIFDLTAISFEKYPYFKAIQYHEFREQMEPLRDILDPELILLAWYEDVLVGFLFAYPDMLSVTAGSPKRVVAKTIATASSVSSLELTAPLVDKIHQVAYEKGYESVIHALSYDNNESLLAMRHFDTDLFRRYALYEWRP
ncbi:hypothetical protein SCG7086_AH_00150 [Chlamydiales bacterium SCGC AG-110-P3]|nr:hypothetical protein SCG7086_AH_00150 [Chlamydiales bacterium SCGC AG-110-P3]